MSLGCKQCRFRNDAAIDSCRATSLDGFVPLPHPELVFNIFV